MNTSALPRLATSGRGSVDWPAFRPLWIIVAIVLALLLLLLWFMGYGPGGAQRAGCCVPGADSAATAAAPAVVPPSSPPEPAPAAAPPAPPPAEKAAMSPPPAAKVFFARDKIDLRANTPEVLAEVVAYLQAHPQATASISGFHDPTGSAQRNEWLANNRSRMVQEALLKTGLAKERLQIAKPTVTTGTGPPEEARRVEVSVQP